MLCLILVGEFIAPLIEKVTETGQAKHQCERQLKFYVRKYCWATFSDLASTYFGLSYI